MRLPPLVACSEVCALITDTGSWGSRLGKKDACPSFLTRDDAASLPYE